MSASNMHQKAAWVVPFESQPSFFGGLPDEEGASNKIPLQSVYGRLPRPAAINPPWSVSPKTTNEAAKATYLSLHAGHFYSQWAQVGDRFTMVVGATDDAPFSPDPLLTLTVMGELVTMNSTVYQMNCLGFDTIHDEFKQSFSIKTKTRLSQRLMHLFLRSHGAKVPHESMDKAYGALEEAYIKKQWYEGVLDISIIWVDVAMNCGRESVSIRNKLTRIGETLESLGRFLEAAQIYIYTAKSAYAEDGDSRAMLHSFGGLAFKRAEAYDDSEASYITALNIYSGYSGRGWDVNGDLINNILSNLLLLYHNWGLETSTPGINVATDVQEMESALIAVLYLAGFKANRADAAAAQEIITDWGPSHKKLAKRSARTFAGARRILHNAAACQSVKDFRQQILSAMIPTSLTLREAPPYERTINEVRRAGDVLFRDGITSGTVMCANPDCSATGESIGEGAFPFCPCKAVFYCSKGCQVSHWPSHKTTCVLYLTKKRMVEDGVVIK